MSRACVEPVLGRVLKHEWRSSLLCMYVAAWLDGCDKCSCDLHGGAIDGCKWR
jgi:hypothetical protein